MKRSSRPQVAGRVSGSHGFLIAPLLLAIVATLVIAPHSAKAQSADSAQDKVLLAVVGYIEESEVELADGQSEPTMQVELIIDHGPRRGEVVVLSYRTQTAPDLSTYQTGDRVYVSQGSDMDGQASYEIISLARSRRLLVMALLFVAIVVVVAGQVGARAIGGMGLSFVIIFAFLLPRLTTGSNPTTSAVLGMILAMPPSYILSHGLNRKTLIALGASAVTLAATALLAGTLINVARISGGASDEAMLVRGLWPETLNIRALYLSGIIVSIVGVLDDISVAQAAVVEQLWNVDKGQTRGQLYHRAMRVGRDHIASMVNTLVLVYAGASLPLLLLLTDSSLPLGYVLSHEMVSEEIVRILATSIGLVLTVPLTTGLAVLVFGRPQTP